MTHSFPTRRSSDLAVISDVDFDYRQDENFKETAAYGELTWHATDNLHFTGGFRHFRHDAETRVEQTTGLWSSIIDSSLSNGDESDTRTLLDRKSTRLNSSH